MRVSQFAARAALVCSAAGIVCALWSLTEDTPASATDEPGLLPGATVEVTRDLVDIPGRAIDQLPDAPIKDTAREPKLVKNVQDQIDQVVTVVDTVKPLPTEAPEVPASLPTAAVPSPAETPAPAAPATVNAVSVLAGPAPTTATPQAVSTAPAAAPAPLCSDQADEPVPPHPGHTAASGTAPCIPSGRNVAGLAAVKPPTQTGADMLAAITPSGPAAPALRLLGELLPRSDLPTGRTEHPEPGPA